MKGKKWGMSSVVGHRIFRETSVFLVVSQHHNVQGGDLGLMSQGRAAGLITL